MLKVGDTVKVIAATEYTSYCDGRKKEYIPIGTICKVVETDIEDDGSQSCAVDRGDGYAYWYKENELEKGRSETMISAEKLINRFEDMANRGTLLCGINVTQEDLLIQIIGTIVKVSMSS